MEQAWRCLCDQFATEWSLFFCGTCLVMLLSSGAINIIFGLCDYFKLFPKHRIQGEKYPNKDLIVDAVKQLCIELFLINPIFIYFGYNLFSYFGVSAFTPLPSLMVVLGQLLFFIMVDDTLFYWSHRLLHHSLIYSHFHKQHHQFGVTLSIATQYAHPVESLISNLIPTLLGPLLVGSHMSVFWLWLFLKLWQSIEAHSGYIIPWSPWSCLPIMGGSKHHEYHHAHILGNYGGVFRFWDYVMGTDMTYKENLVKSPTQL